MTTERFILKASTKNGITGFYTGKSGHEYVHSSIQNAFQMSEQRAVTLATQYNGFERTTGWTFSAVQLDSDTPTNK